MIDRPTTRTLPVLDVVPPRPATAFGPPVLADARVEEYRPEAATLPSFAIWTLGCQMNRSDSEEMAGRLLAAGCAEAPSFETADLVVINTCAIREAAEQKVIGRQGQLARLKIANPGLRVVLTGCAVRERDRAGLAGASRRSTCSFVRTRSRSWSTDSAWLRRRASSAPRAASVRSG